MRDVHCRFLRALQAQQAAGILVRHSQPLVGPSRAIFFSCDRRECERFRTLEDERDKLVAAAASIADHFLKEARIAALARGRRGR
jgi:hypothetical protein